MEKQWVVLRGLRNEATQEMQYRQQGPFTADEVLGLVHRGEIRFADYAWRKGLEKWARIGQLPEFDQQAGAAQRPEVHSSLKAAPVQIGLKDVFDHVLNPAKLEFTDVVEIQTVTQADGKSDAEPAQANQVEEPATAGADTEKHETLDVSSEIPTLRLFPLWLRIAFSVIVSALFMLGLQKIIRYYIHAKPEASVLKSTNGF